jgi:hypothetical protein
MCRRSVLCRAAVAVCAPFSVQPRRRKRQIKKIRFFFVSVFSIPSHPIPAARCAVLFNPVRLHHISKLHRRCHARCPPPVSCACVLLNLGVFFFPSTFFRFFFRVLFFTFRPGFGSKVGSDKKSQKKSRFFPVTNKRKSQRRRRWQAPPAPSPGILFLGKACVRVRRRNKRACSLSTFSLSLLSLVCFF